ncbi:MAG: type sorting protein, partial [Bacteroidota bacterium]|nr:type sorting protein [Bacteroidota bacterium]
MKRKLILITTLAAAAWLWCGAATQANAEDFEILWSVKTQISSTVHFSHDNRWNISGCDSPNTYIFNVSDGSLVNNTIPDMLDPFSSDDDKHIFGVYYKDIAYFSTETWNNESYFEKCGNIFSSLYITNDRKYLAATTADGFKFWDIKTGKIIKSQTIINDPQA